MGYLVSFIINLLLSPLVKKVGKSVSILMAKLRTKVERCHFFRTRCSAAEGVAEMMLVNIAVIRYRAVQSYFIQLIGLLQDRTS